MNFQIFDTVNIDFEYTDRYDFTIFRACFDRYCHARFNKGYRDERSKKLIPKTEDKFFELIRQAADKEVNTNKLIEKPTKTGETCFRIASYMSKKISQYILAEDIEVDFISKQFMLPWFEHEEVTEQMLHKNINPLIIYRGKNQLDRYPGRFEKFSEILDRFQNGAFYFTEDTNCNEGCSSICGSVFRRFKCYPGSLVEMTLENFIGGGAFGEVYKGKWHGSECAMKYTPILDSKSKNYVENIEREFEFDADEYLKPLKTSGKGVILPIGMFRQQNQYLQQQTNRWQAINYQVNVYPKYDCNLYELHEKKFEIFSDDIIENILNQCLIRK